MRSHWAQCPAPPSSLHDSPRISGRVVLGRAHDMTPEAFLTQTPWVTDNAWKWARVWHEGGDLSRSGRERFSAATMAAKTLGKRDFFIPQSPSAPPCAPGKSDRGPARGCLSQAGAALTLCAVRDTVVWARQPRKRPSPRHLGRP